MMVTKIGLAVGILLVMVLAVLGILQAKSNAEITQIWNILQPEAPSREPFSSEMIANQPEPVQRYFLHAIALGTPIASSVHIKMQESFRLAANHDWMPMQAEEVLSTDGFVWKATAGQGMLQRTGSKLNPKPGQQFLMDLLILGLIGLVPGLGGLILSVANLVGCSSDPIFE